MNVYNCMLPENGAKVFLFCTFLRIFYNILLMMYYNAMHSLQYVKDSKILIYFTCYKLAAFNTLRKNYLQYSQ